jgi:hypothetical protein
MLKLFSGKKLRALSSSATFPLKKRVIIARIQASGRPGREASAALARLNNILKKWLNSFAV